MASKENNKNDASSASHHLQHQQSSGGKFHSAITTRGLHPLHHPYIRSDLYRSFYSIHPDSSLLESYQRSLNSSLNQKETPLHIPTKPSPLSTLNLPVVSNPADVHLMSDELRTSPSSSISSSSDNNITQEKSNTPSSQLTASPHVNLSKP